MAAVLRRLDDRVLGPARSARLDASDVVWGVVQVSRLVLLLLAVVLLGAVAVVDLHLDETGAVARRVLAAAWQVSGPFARVFDVSSRPLRVAADYGFEAALYVVLAVLLGRAAPRR